MAQSEILDFVKEKLDQLQDSELETVTFKSIREDLIPKFGSDEVGSCKGEIKSFVSEYIANRATVAATADQEEGNEKSETDEKDESDGSDNDGSDSSDSSDSDDDHPTIAGLPAEWRESFGEICWVKGQKSFPWWPAYIYNPSRLTEKLKQKAIPVAGKKHTVMYFGSKDFGFVFPNQIRTPFEDFAEEFSQQKITKKDLAWFERAIPEARAELAKPKEDRMFIERPKRTRKSTSGTKKKSPAPQKATPKKKTPVKSKSTEPELEPESEEEEEVQEEEEEAEEEEVVSEEESEAEFDEAPKKSRTPSKAEKRSSEKPKKEKAAKPKTPKDESLSTAELVAKYRVKSFPEGASKKTRAAAFVKSIKKALSFPASGATEVKSSSSKSSEKTSSEGSAKKKPRADSAKSKPEHTQKKRKAEEEAMAEAERERIKKLQKSSDVPVWKQVRKESDAVSAAKPSKREGEGKRAVATTPAPKPEETREQRAKRLTGLIDLHLKKSPPNVEAALKCMGKARDMSLTIEELRASGFAEAINQLRKFDDPEISREAKSIRNHLKQALAQQAPAKTEATSAPEPVTAPVVTEPTAPVEEKSSGFSGTAAEVGEGKGEPMEVVQQDQEQGQGQAEEKEEGEGDRADNTSPPAEEEDLAAIPAAISSSPQFQTSLALLLDPLSAVRDFPREALERIVATVTRVYPKTVESEAYVPAIHKFAFELKREKHDSLLQSLRTNPSVLSIEYLVRTAAEDWTSLPH